MITFPLFRQQNQGHIIPVPVYFFNGYPLHLTELIILINPIITFMCKQLVREQIPRVIFKTFAENLSNILATVNNLSRAKY
jgi:hypothetical protein